MAEVAPWSGAVEQAEGGVISTVDRQITTEINLIGVLERSTIKEQYPWIIGGEPESEIRRRMGGGALDWVGALHTKSGVRLLPFPSLFCLTNPKILQQF